MAEEVPNQVRAGFGIVLIRENVNQQREVLLGKRISTSHGDGEFQLPGGKLEWMEDLYEGMKREVTEETGLVTSLSFRHLGFTNDRWPQRNKHYITVYAEGTVVGGHLGNPEPDKCAGWEWFPLSALPTPMFCDTFNVLREHYPEANFRPIE